MWRIAGVLLIAGISAFFYFFNFTPDIDALLDIWAGLPAFAFIALMLFLEWKGRR